jgi:hypothetical protein
MHLLSIISFPCSTADKPGSIPGWVIYCGLSCFFWFISFVPASGKARGETIGGCGKFYNGLNLTIRPVMMRGDEAYKGPATWRAPQISAEQHVRPVMPQQK